MSDRSTVHGNEAQRSALLGSWLLFWGRPGDRLRLTAAPTDDHEALQPLRREPNETELGCVAWDGGHGTCHGEQSTAGGHSTQGASP